MHPSPDELAAQVARLKKQVERERAARAEAEAIAERVTRELFDNQQGLELLQTITVAANQATTIPEAMQFALRKICEFTGWQVGHIYLVANDGSMDLVPADLWHVQDEERFAEFRELTMQMRFKSGVGLPGKVFANAKPSWIRNVAADENFPRASRLPDSGIKSAMGFPLMIGMGVAGVMEFFTDQEFEPDSKLMDRLAHVGAQLGRVIERAEAQVALARSEAYFRKLTENSLDLITILNADGTIRYESRSIEQVLGFTPEEFNGKNAFEFVHPDDVQRVAHAFTIALQQDGHTEMLTFQFRHRDGSYRILEGMGLNLLPDPDVAGIVFNSRDVTERKRLEQQFLQAQKVQAIGQLAAGVAHDFNNLLTAILGYSDMVLMQINSESPFYTHASGIKQAALRAAALTRQLLAFGRKQILQPLVINLNTSIIEMEKMLRRLLGADVTLVLHAAPDLGQVKADPGQIEQVILNLAVNARDAMPRGGNLTIQTGNIILDEEYARLNNEVAAGRYVMLAVSDNGTGMPPAIRARLFEPFFTTKEIGKGTGLGLATCHGIVKQSGGHIAVYSEPGEGTTFKVYLPRVDAAAESVPKTPLPVGIPRGKETILFVEDEPMLRELGAGYLAGLGYKVLSAANGRQALNLLQSNPATKLNLLFTDVVMPEMGGKELADILQELLPATKVLFCSGYTEEALNLRGRAGAANAFMPKPYTIEDLARKVREMLDGGG